ncbi:hypothetical protein [Enterococcus termitis]|uniref:Uncharacterized protein n=1 Tax=Enterococcus termitis TaxID=332950 RepID=A0A1E5GVS8_9ENTE|nr:hypothetical protein [Enterococcus termitis]OEG16791.1 hypothetical protein BCR25_04125 [Enterococcus termitis]OJG99500.1 hypothetical protein RV18_GL001568 [Enterococcus termitis]
MSLISSEMAISYFWENLQNEIVNEMTNNIKSCEKYFKRKPTEDELLELPFLFKKLISAKCFKNMEMFVEKIRIEGGVSESEIRTLFNRELLVVEDEIKNNYYQ